MTIQDTNKSSDEVLRIALPSDGELYDSTMAFMRACGMTVSRPNSRRYTGTIPTIPGVEVLFQRTSDVAHKVEEGSAELGVTGLDRVLEYRSDERRASILMENLEYGRCDFVIAVPNSWMDVTSLTDLADLALEFRQDGKQLRIATKYPRLLRSYLYDRGINYFMLVPASGAMEAAPAAGYADLIADVTATGTTLRENQLKQLAGGTILSSQSCLIVNPITLSRSPRFMALSRSIVELMEGHLRAEPYYRVTANVRASTAEQVSSAVLAQPDLSGLRGPTVARVYNVEEQDWFSVSLLTKKGKLLDVVDHLRNCGAVDVAASQLSYLFDRHSEAYEALFGKNATIKD